MCRPAQQRVYRDRRGTTVEYGRGMRNALRQLGLTLAMTAAFGAVAGGQAVSRVTPPPDRTAAGMPWYASRAPLFVDGGVYRGGRRVGVLQREHDGPRDDIRRCRDLRGHHPRAAQRRVRADRPRPDAAGTRGGGRAIPQDHGQPRPVVPGRLHRRDPRNPWRAHGRGRPVGGRAESLVRACERRAVRPS